jgi:hypothetical protein
MMRRLFVLFAVGALVCAVAATTAFALTNNTANYQVKLKKKGKPSKKKPATLSYRGILDVGTSDNTQPNVAPTTKIYFPKQIIENAKYFPKCDPKKLDGQTTVPAACKKAVVGHGTATASGGSPGAAINPATSESLTVTAYNGLKGKQLLLAVNGQSPLVISNRVIIGTIGRGGGKFGYSITFAVPADLQFQLGLQVALTHFDVTVNKTTTAKVKGKKKKVSYTALTSCPKNHTLPLKTTVNFDGDGTPGGPGTPGGQSVTTTGTTKC